MVTLYTVHADGVPVFLPKDSWDSDYEPENVTPTKAVSTLEDNHSGTLTFSILPSHIAYNTIELITSTIKVTEHVYNDDGIIASEKIIWMGRPISIDEDITSNTKSYICEGALSYLNDIVCYPLDGGWYCWIFDIYDDQGIDRETAEQEVKNLTANEQKNMLYKYAIQKYLDTGGNGSDIFEEGGRFGYTDDLHAEFFGNCTATYGNGYNYMCLKNRKINTGNVTIANDYLNGFFDHTTETNGAYSPNEYPNGVWSFQASFNKDTKAGGSLDQIIEMTTEFNGGHLVMRYETENSKDKMYLDYIGDIVGTFDAYEAQYGQNIVDFSGSIELNAPVTDIIPRGKCVSTYQGENNFTMRDAHSPFTEWIGINNGYQYGVHLLNQDLVEKYGRIQQIVDFPEIESPQELKAAGEEWLRTNSSFLFSEYQVGIVDLGRVYGNTISPIHLLDLVHVSVPGKVNDYFPVTSLEIDILNPINTTVTFSTTKTSEQTYSMKRAAAADAVGFQKIRAGDSISEALAGNLDKTKKLTVSTNANTSLSENVKNTNPTGKTGVISVVTNASLNEDGSLKVIYTDLLFVNGLLTKAEFSGGGPEYNYLTQDSIESDIIYRGIVKPVNDAYALYGSTLVGGGSMANPYYEQTNMLFGNDEQLTWNDKTYYKYPYYACGETADDLILDTDYSSAYRGEYYRLVNGEKQYVPIPCMYYVPTGISGDLWVLYIGDLNQHLITELSPDGRSDCPAIIGKHISNLGTLMVKRTDAKPNTYQRTMSASSVLYHLADQYLTDMVKERLVTGLKYDLPNYTSPEEIIGFRGFSWPTSCALLIAPYIVVDHVINTSTVKFKADLFITPVFVQPIKDSTDRYASFWSSIYANGDTTYRLNRMRLYTGYRYGSGYDISYIPKDYLRSGSTLQDFHHDMNKETWTIAHGDVKTPITKTKYYLFSSEADMMAVIDAYKDGSLTQSEIEEKYRSTIRFFGNKSDPTTNSEMKMGYYFNNRYTSYSLPGTPYTDSL